MENNSRDAIISQNSSNKTRVIIQKLKTIFAKKSNPWRFLLFMTFFLPFWITFGRALLGSGGWMTIMFLIFCAPYMIGILLLFSILIKIFYVEKVFSGIFEAMLPTFFWSVFLFGFFIVDGGDGGQQGSIFTNIAGKLSSTDTTYSTDYHWFSNICADAFSITAMIFLSIILIQIVVCIVINIKSRRKIVQNTHDNPKKNSILTESSNQQINRGSTYHQHESKSKHLSTIVQLLVILLVINCSYMIFAVQKHAQDTKNSEDALKYNRSDESKNSLLPIIVYGKSAVSDFTFYDYTNIDTCQPQNFDPSTSTYYKVKQSDSPQELYKVKGFRDNYLGGVMMINGWDKENEGKITLQPPYEVDYYKFKCENYGFTYVIDLITNKTEHALFTHVLHFSFSSDKKQIYMIQNSYGEINTFIVNIGQDSSTILASVKQCVSSSEPGGFWQGDRILAYTKNKGVPDYITDICVWDKSGEFISGLSTTSYWGSNDILAEQIGLLPNNPDIFYAYTSKDEKICSIFLADIKAAGKQKSIDILNKKEYPKANHCISPKVEFDFSKTYYDHGEIRYRIENDADSSGKSAWNDWQTTPIK